MFHGQLVNGDTLLLHLLTVDASGNPATPSACPRATLTGPAGMIASGLYLEPVEPGVTTGLFLLRLYLGSLYPPGQYTATLRWLQASVTRHQEASFTVLPGGDSSGRVRSLIYYQRPQANFLVQSRDGDRFVTGKNPRR